MKTKYWIAIIALLLVLCVLGSLFFLSPGKISHRAEIVSQGRVLRVIDLHIDQEFTIETDAGSNTVTVKDGRIAVTQASCPDHYCMHRGYANSGADIVCLPNRLVIRFLGEQDVDGVVG